jgi:hypothetical protein
MAWYEEPLRWLQLNLTGDDPLSTDVGHWKQFWQEARVEGVTLSSAGAMAVYPTDIPLHPRAPHRGDRDLFGELTAAAKELDIRVLARFEASSVSDELAAAHPDWLAQRDPSRASLGIDVAAFLAGGRAMPCFNGPYFREFLPAVMTELASRYPIDGFYANAWPYIGMTPPSPATMCSCPSCLASWRLRGHDQLPERADADDPIWAEYVEWVQDLYVDVQRTWQRHVKAIRPELSFVCNLHGSIASGVPWQTFGAEVDLFVNDSQGRHMFEVGDEGVMTHALWAASRSAAIVQAVAAGKPMCHIVGGWHSDAPALRRLAKEPLELRMMFAQVVARGARPWCNVGGGAIHDRRWMEPLRSFYRWHAENASYLRHQRSLAEVGVVWTPSAVWPAWWRPGRRPRGPALAAAFRGWHEVLLRARTSFNVVPDNQLVEDALDAYRVLILPSGTTVTEAGVAALHRFVGRGGGLILGCGTVGVDTKVGPSDLAGVVVGEAPAGPTPNAYVEITTTRDHPLLGGIGDTDYIPAGSWTAPPAALAGATGAGRFQAPFPFVADFAFPEHPPLEDPMLTLRDRVVYLATDIDALHGVHQLPDIRVVLVNCLDAAFGDDRRTCTVTGPGVLDVHPWQQQDSWTVHLVNLTNPNLYGGPIDELVGVGEQAVRLFVDGADASYRARLLRSGDDVDLEQDANGSITVKVPSVEDFEVVAIERDKR